MRLKKISDSFIVQVITSALIDSMAISFAIKIVDFV